MIDKRKPHPPTTCTDCALQTLLHPGAPSARTSSVWNCLRMPRPMAHHAAARKGAASALSARCPRVAA